MRLETRILLGGNWAESTRNYILYNSYSIFLARSTSLLSSLKRKGVVGIPVKMIVVRMARFQCFRRGQEDEVGLREKNSSQMIQWQFLGPLREPLTDDFVPKTNRICAFYYRYPYISYQTRPIQFQYARKGGRAAQKKHGGSPVHTRQAVYRATSKKRERKRKKRPDDNTRTLHALCLLASDSTSASASTAHRIKSQSHLQFPTTRPQLPNHP
jgi:hypothetical protein